MKEREDTESGQEGVPVALGLRDRQARGSRLMNPDEGRSSCPPVVD